LESLDWENFCAATLQLSGFSLDGKPLLDIAGRYKKIDWLKNLAIDAVSDDDEGD
jgi:hypothetical protein